MAMKLTERLFDFIESAPTSLHAAKSVSAILEESGYTKICECGGTELVAGGKYYIARGGAVIAFRKRENCTSFGITASHSDAPSFKLNFVSETRAAYTRLSVERYGGSIHYSWLDRPLSVAGRVMISVGGEISEKLVKLDEDLAVIPSVAPHLMRDVNSGFSPNAAVDLQPLYSIGAACVLDKVAAAAGVARENIISHDLYLYTREHPTTFGAEGELILAPRIDDLASVYTALSAFIDAPDTASTPVFAMFDHEEVGSSTTEGAASTLLSDVLALICPDKSCREAAIRASLMLSVDGAHALHPNHPELSDPANRPTLGGGVAIKYNANRRYATDAASDAILRTIAAADGIALQVYANRADLPGGSTLGSIAATGLGIPTVDIGIPQLAMHSIMESAAASDVDAMYKLLSAFYASSVERDSESGALKVTRA